MYPTILVLAGAGRAVIMRAHVHFPEQQVRISPQSKGQKALRDSVGGEEAFGARQSRMLPRL